MFAQGFGGQTENEKVTNGIWEQKPTNHFLFFQLSPLMSSTCKAQVLGHCDSHCTSQGLLMEQETQTQISESASTDIYMS